ncbi:hypothetical protein EVAR_61883_1 [Eumeta japonica]|uniref:Uncharacterized protein n=1 Tax=Eumeta variegata TaxID=151549 RepID=A0A4C1YZF0_EUMVA|nr:hypothetical protein EVAR_61883_1 [Eumeta japonica]
MKCFYVISFVLVSCFAERVADINQNILRRSQCDDHQHVFLTPGVLAGGSSNRACISRLGNSVVGTAHLVLTLESNGNTIARASRDLAPGKLNTYYVRAAPPA